MTTEEFIEKSIVIHKEYDYSESKYINAHTALTIICKIHGPFQQRPDAHIHQKQGCPKCGLANRKHPGQKTTAKFVEQAVAKWGDRNDYTGTAYVRKTDKINFTCKEHGPVSQLPTLHLRAGCPYCSGRGISKHTLESFKIIANKIHNNKYDYTDSVFVRMTDMITVRCPQHGSFEQRAGNHIHLENGCPQCAYLVRSSKPEKEIYQFIKSIYGGNVIENDREALDGKEIDIYIPDLQLGIEYHGLYWHLESVRGKKHHYDKWNIADQKKIRLIQIYENEWGDKSGIIKSKLSGLLEKNERIFARKTELVELDRHQKNEFLDRNHLQGSDSSKISYGLVYNSRLVSCMTFGPSRFNKKFKYELVRFCNVCGVSVVGGASKLLSHFRKKYAGSIISYADKRYSDGGLYKTLGFRLDGETEPSFMYVDIKNSKCYNRMNFQKQNLKQYSEYDENLSEYEIMCLRGFDRIWDCGQYRFVMDEL